MTGDTAPIAPIDTAELRELAEKAKTREPICAYALGSLLRYYRKNRDHDDFCTADNCELPLPDELDAHYIAAASPDVVLRLLDELETARAEAAALKSERDEARQLVLDCDEAFGGRNNDYPGSPMDLKLTAALEKWGR